jgi:ribosome-binding protein aMBF1 (putative translation factor)
MLFVHDPLLSGPVLPVIVAGLTQAAARPRARVGDAPVVAAAATGARPPSPSPTSKKAAWIGRSRYLTERRDTRIGTTIAGLREQRRWSQRALAKVVGLDQSAVSRIEAGKRRLAAGELEAFAQALGVPRPRCW